MKDSPEKEINPDTQEKVTEEIPVTDARQSADLDDEVTTADGEHTAQHASADESAAEDCAQPEKKTPEQEAAEWRDIALRRQADLENFRKRIERERLDSIRYANASLLEELLPVIDNFEMGLEAARNESADSMIFKGMEMVKKQLVDFLESRGVKEVETGSAEFDPAIHEAMGQEESSDIADGHIVRTVRRGYMLNDRLLRAASVIVATSSSETEAGDAGDVKG